MKLILALLWMIPALSFSQSLERQIYQHYFERIFRYEPSFIRENKISGIVTRKIEMIGDSVVYNEVEDSMTFRRDGRPIHEYIWSNAHQLCTVVGFFYDSLGNLLSYSPWLLCGENADIQGENAQEVFVYDSCKLIKHYSVGVPYKHYEVSSLSNEAMRETNLTFGKSPGALPLIVYSGDSIVYDEMEKKATIFHASYQELEIPYSSRSLPSVFQKLIDYRERLYSGQDNCGNKPLDKKAVWEKNNCNYREPALQKICKVTGLKCLPMEFLTICSGFQFRIDDLESGTMRKTCDNADLAEFVSEADTSGFYRDSLDLRTIIRIDFQNKKIELQTAVIFYPQTSISRVTYHRTIYHYDFSLRLLWKDEYIKGLSEPFHNASGKEQTIYEYHKNGLLKRKMTFFEPTPFDYTKNSGLHSEQVIYEISSFE